MKEENQQARRARKAGRALAPVLCSRSARQRDGETVSSKPKFLVQRDPRFRASAPPERPFRSLRGGTLPEFPCLWSVTTVAWSVPAFLPRKPAVGAPLLSAMAALGPLDL